MTRDDASRDDSSAADAADFNTIVIGGGQAGLTVGRELQKRDVDFVILDAAERVGDAWRRRWDSLRLFTQARMNGLPDMAFPGSGEAFVGKDQVAEFLEQYAEAMQLPVRSGTRVVRVTRDGEGFAVQTADSTLRSRNVVIAMADYQRPKVPEFADRLDPSIVQLHSTDYKNPSQLADGAALVVGMGNSGADIAHELAASRPTIIAGHPAGAIPFPIESWFGRTIGSRIVRFAAVKLLNTGNPIGRKARPKMIDRAAPLVRVRPKDLDAVGVRRVDRIVGAEAGRPVTTDGEVLDVPNVIWCTGFVHGFDWVDIPIFDDGGRPAHHRGIVDEVPGLYFVGLFFLYALWSETITGMQRDAKHIVEHLVARQSPATAV